MIYIIYSKIYNHLQPDLHPRKAYLQSSCSYNIADPREQNSDAFPS